MGAPYEETEPHGTCLMIATYLANSQLVTSTGPTSYFNFCVHRTGKSSYSFANYHTQDHHQIVLAQVPDTVLPPLHEDLEDADITFRDERAMLLMAVTAELMLRNYQGEPLPFILSGPQNYPAFNNQLTARFFDYLAVQETLPIDYGKTRILATGRTGVFEAIRIAQHYLASGAGEFVLVGGVDSCHNTDWLHFLDRDKRVRSERPTSNGNCFAPGEGASLLLLTSNPNFAMDYEGFRVRITEPGFGDEPGHLYSDKPYLGKGLDQAVKQALANIPADCTINTVYSSMNGENYWAKEFGVAMTRSSHRLERINHLHPADSYGDIGAAAGGGLIALAAYHSTKNGKPKNTLICTSSDTEYRAALCVLPERINP